MIELVPAGKFSFVPCTGAPGWLLQEGGSGRGALPLDGEAFSIGRAPDCRLVLPDSEELQRTTSRWHCHFSRRDGQWLVADGSLSAVPETGGAKPSVTGTFLNDRMLWRPEPVKAGDTLRVGPWEFKFGDSERQAVDIDRLLARIGEGDAVVIGKGDTGTRMGFESLAELFTKLYSIKDTEEYLSAILAFALEKIAPAQVAAILTVAPDGIPSVHLALQRGKGRILDLRLSSGLLKSLPADRAFLLKSQIQDATKSQLEQNISSGLLVPLRGGNERLGVLYMDNRSSGGSFEERDLYLANALANVAALQLALERQSYLMRVEQNMQQYFGPDVVRLIVESSRQGKPVSLGVKECVATVFFVDIKDFSAFCRGRSPVEVGELLNPYFEMAAQAIQGHGGHVDKFIGDAVMGVFGSTPLEDPRVTLANHALGAVDAGRQLIALWSRWSAARWGAPIPLRIGINTGPLVLGNIGFPGRMEYSALGDTVNLASRLEGQAHPNGIALSEATRLKLAGEVDCTDGGEVEVRGFGRVKVWRIDA